MRYTKWVRGIRGPTRESFTREVTTIVVSLAGYGGKRTRFKSLSKELKNELDVPGSRLVAAVTGVGRLTTKAEERVAKNIRDGIKRVVDAGGARPKVIFLCKSMGGRVLRNASVKLGAHDIEVDLFVGVDVSKRLGYHYQNYVDNGGDLQYAMIVDGNIKELVNLYEKQKQCGQNGHVFLYRETRPRFQSSPYFDRAINIDVAGDGFDKTTLMPDAVASPITPHNPTHKTIEEDVNVIDVVKRYAWRAAVRA